MITPRSFKPLANVIDHVYKTMLEQHPQAFDCLVFAAKDDSRNEILTDIQPEGCLLDGDTRAQEYEAPVQARAMRLPDPAGPFDIDKSGGYESFHSMQEDIKLIVSVPNLRLYSIIQWAEYISPDSEETVDRNVYIADIKPVGKTLNSRMLYYCRPLLAEGILPEEPPAQNNPNPAGSVNPGAATIPQGGFL